MKQGTRCECRENHDWQQGPLSQHERTECGRDAVRLVTVREVAGDGMGGHTVTVSTLALCAACAEHHEKGGAR